MSSVGRSEVQSDTEGSENIHLNALDQASQVPTSTSEPFIIATGEKGRGLFATEDIPPFAHIHTAPCILVARDEYHSHLRHTVLEHYLFNCSDGDRLLALGVGSLFNHDSRAPNVDYKLEKASLTIRYTASYRGVKAGEELCIYYGNKLWFDDVDEKGRCSSGSGSDSGKTDDGGNPGGLEDFLRNIHLEDDDGD